LDEVARLTAELQESRRSLDVLREGQRRDSEEHKQNADRLRMQVCPSFVALVFGETLSNVNYFMSDE
jgi:hypothetical protein